jgi:deferrochelatase/peroxidase EfeB
MRFSDSQFSEVDLKDIQGLVRFGHAHLEGARFFLLKIADPAAARAWLDKAPIATAASRHAPNFALQVAFTYDGLKALGLPKGALQGFSDEFIVGMTGDSSRSRRLGDVEVNDPQSWRWGGPGKVPHMIVLLYALPDQLMSRETEIKGSLWQAAFTELDSLCTKDNGANEPFGFRDGVSQPALDWERRKPRRLRDTRDYTNVAALGEFLLGYPNEYARYTDRPLLDPDDDPQRLLPLAEDAPGKRDLGRNGTYLVFRDLAQDVPGFWRNIDALANHDQDKRWKLAHAMVGRTMAGDPIVPLREESIDGVPTDREQAWLDQFTFQNDPNGTACPFGAHIRRVNPRNADLPSDARWPFRRLLRMAGFCSQGPHDDLLSSTRFHRILRRGREYGSKISAAGILGDPQDEGGEPTPRPTDDDLAASRGLRFICLNANISRQFEFIQTAWVANAKFDGLDERDPLLGNRAPTLAGLRTDRFTRPRDNGLCSRASGLSQFVTVSGGAYFFMPGISALRYIASLS